MEKLIWKETRMIEVTQGEVLREACKIAGLSISKASKKIGMSYNTLHPKVSQSRKCDWEEINNICFGICGKPAYSIATSLAVMKSIEIDKAKSSKK